jgi:TM2 domain-containing membrane protein YozV
MSENQDWSAPGGTPAHQQPPVDQPYGPPQGPYQPPPGPYQGPQGPYGYQSGPCQQPYPQGYPGPVRQVVPKNAGIALLISFFVPGVGSLYAGKTNTGVVILVGYIISWLLTIVIIGIAGVIGFWIWGMVDAYQAAQAWNRARGIES